mmetsp:Transcript_157416/g.277688  ORF Transcript_157416/g.277688 Transcript_157416/m.277688 type:complete len:166 (-) Transcript_157416:62-559(-)
MTHWLLLCYLLPSAQASSGSSHKTSWVQISDQALGQEVDKSLTSADSISNRVSVQSEMPRMLMRSEKSANSSKPSRRCAEDDCAVSQLLVCGYELLECSVAAECQGLCCREKSLFHTCETYECPEGLTLKDKASELVCPDESCESIAPACCCTSEADPPLGDKLG